MSTKECGQSRPTVVKLNMIEKQFVEFKIKEQDFIALSLYSIKSLQKD